MYSDSRKARHNSYAYRRAELLLAKPAVSLSSRDDVLAGPHNAEDLAALAQARKVRVSSGILGFVPAPADA